MKRRRAEIGAADSELLFFFKSGHNQETDIS